MKAEPACTCDEHAKKAWTNVNGHKFRRDHDSQNGMWRWRCSCGRRGHWQAQSPNVSYHQWLDHVRRSGNA
jgi:hypothetical protein